MTSSEEKYYIEGWRKKAQRRITETIVNVLVPATSRFRFIVFWRADEAKLLDLYLKLEDRRISPDDVVAAFYYKFAHTKMRLRFRRL